MKNIFTLLLIVVCGTAFAQQDVQFTQYMNNKILINPGYTGLDGSICLAATHRTQWASFAGAPVSQNVNAHMPIKALRGGLGLSITLDQIGKEINNHFSLNYAYHREIGQGKLGIGVGLGLINKTINGVGWIAPDGSSGTTDPSIPQGLESSFAPDFSFGMFYMTDKYYVGLSSFHLAELANQLGETSQIGQKRHFYLTGGYNIEATAELTIRPSILVRSDIASTNFDFNALAVYNNRFWAGFSYRLEDAVAIIVGLNVIEGLKLGYSYDLTTSEINNYSSGSHEILLNYCFTIERPPAQPERYRNVRFL